MVKVFFICKDTKLITLCFGAFLSTDLVKFGLVTFRDPRTCVFLLMNSVNCVDAG